MLTTGGCNLKRMETSLKARVYQWSIWGSLMRRVLAIFETNNPEEFIRIFNDPVTMDAMSNDRVTGGVEMFLIDETFNI